MGKLKQFEVTFDCEQDVFYPGDTVRGRCVLELRHELKVKSLIIYIRGAVRVHWTESQNTGPLALYTEHLNSAFDYFSEQQILFNSEESCSNETWNKGVHQFSFFFQLPSSGLSTSFEGKFGNVRYWIKAELERPWSLNYQAKRAFTVIHPISINEYLSPVEINAERSFCCFLCTPGCVTIYAKTDRTGYCPGESIAIYAEFENHTGRSIIPHASLHQMQTFLAEGRKRSRSIKFTTVTGLTIEPHRSSVWDGQLLKIPSVTPSILNCQLIRVEYSIHIVLHIPLIGYRYFAKLPIVIGTVPCHPTGGFTYSLSESELPHSSRTIVNQFEVTNSRATPPPTYQECVDGSVDIRDDEDVGILGETRFTPRYIYVNNQNREPPPAYSVVDPYPR